MPGKSPRVKLNISSSASSTALGEAKGVAQLLETLDGEASWYPSEKVRVLGFLFDVKPNYSKEGAQLGLGPAPSTWAKGESWREIVAPWVWV